MEVPPMPNRPLTVTMRLSPVTGAWILFLGDRVLMTGSLEKVVAALLSVLAPLPGRPGAAMASRRHATAPFNHNWRSLSSHAGASCARAAGGGSDGREREPASGMSPGPTGTIDATISNPGSG